jgi:hypothetical protein
MVRAIAPFGLARSMRRLRQIETAPRSWVFSKEVTRQSGMEKDGIGLLPASGLPVNGKHDAGRRNDAGARAMPPERKNQIVNT